MKLAISSHEVIDFPNNPYEKIENAARICYQSSHQKTNTSAIPFTKMLIKKGHHTPLEFIPITLKIITDRGATHELVRHRHASYNQESSRYCNYGNNKFDKQITFIVPQCINLRKTMFEKILNSNPYQMSAVEVSYFKNISKFASTWISAMENIECLYLEAISIGESPNAARSILPNSTKSEIMMHTNLRELRLIFSQRTSKAAHFEIRYIMRNLFAELNQKYPHLFFDLSLEPL